MNKADLVINLKKKFPYLSDADCLVCVNELIDYMAHHLSKSNKFEIRGFGTFMVKRLSARIVRNPKTGVKLNRSETAYPSFKSGQVLNDRINKIHLF
jgi:integration host factor subunit beta